MDLSAIPVPEADKRTTPKLSPEEIRSMPVQISVVPIGFVPPPIIKLDASGMPREQYRDPLEYPPTSYHFATQHGTIRMVGAQNQLTSPTAVPRRNELAFSYELPPSQNAVPTGDKKRLKSIGSFNVPAGATHLVVVLWKDPADRLWSDPQFKVIDVSPGAVKAHEAIVINGSGRELAIERGDKPYKIVSGFIGKIALPVNAQGEVPMYVSASTGVGWHRLSSSVLGPGKDERIFVIAWQTPQSAAQPTGVSLQAAARRLPQAKPFEPQKEG